MSHRTRIYVDTATAMWGEATDIAFVSPGTKAIVSFGNGDASDSDIAAYGKIHGREYRDGDCYIDVVTGTWGDGASIVFISVDEDDEMEELYGSSDEQIIAFAKTRQHQEGEWGTYRPGS